MNALRTFFIAISILALMLALSSLYVVREGQNSILLRLGKMVDDPQTGKTFVGGPGLHYKLPIVNTVRMFDTRLQTLDIKTSRIITKEQKYVLVDYYIKWRIEQLPLYYKRTSGNMIRAETLLEQKVNDGIRAEFGQRVIKDVLSKDRERIMLDLKKQANSTAENLGIEVIDVRIKRIDFPSEVSTTVYRQMRVKREESANSHRSTGRADATEIRAKANKKVTELIAGAQGKAKRIRGEGDAIAAQIYSKAFSQDPDFYAFSRSLQAYQAAFSDKNDILVLRPDSQFFKYFSTAGNRK